MSEETNIGCPSFPAPEEDEENTNTGIDPDSPEEYAHRSSACESVRVAFEKGDCLSLAMMNGHSGHETHDLCCAECGGIPCLLIFQCHACGQRLGPNCIYAHKKTCPNPGIEGMIEAVDDNEQSYPGRSFSCPGCHEWFDMESLHHHLDSRMCIFCHEKLSECTVKDHDRFCTHTHSHSGSKEEADSEEETRRVETESRIYKQQARERIREANIRTRQIEEQTKELKNRIAEQAEIIESKRAESNMLRVKLARKRVKISRLKEDNARQEEVIAEREREVAELKETIAKQQAENMEKTRTVINEQCTIMHQRIIIRGLAGELGNSVKERDELQTRVDQLEEALRQEMSRCDELENWEPRRAMLWLKGIPSACVDKINAVCRWVRGVFRSN